MNKTILKLLSAFALSLVLVTCSSSDLDIDDPNSASETSATVAFLATGIEAGARLDHAIYLRAVAVMGRDAYYFEPSDPRYTGELIRGPIDANGFLLTRPWAARYRVVRNCLTMIDRANELTSGADGNSAAGFARTYMAYQLILNLNYTDTNGILVDIDNGTIVSKGEALSAIASMLDTGYNELQNGGSSFPFRLSPGLSGFDTPATFAQFNRALKARVSAYQSNWQGVLDALGGSFIDASGDMNTGVYHVYSTGSGDQLNPIFENPSADFVKLMGHPSFETDAEAGDARFSNNVFKRATVTTFDGLSSDLGVIKASGSTAPFPIIRNEELVLLRAEANIQLNNLGSAEADLNAVRSNAGLGPVSLSSTDQAINQLLHERRYSLWLEGHRWADMRRYNRLDQLPIDRDGDTVVDKMPIPTDEI
ncbi:MAG: RagB/SusD family nutrient uptake outer membrane protein [Acidobacteria bacterium]|nr:RagB/SusD family nutrient uptake outer membrane protein [Acidobacteriota bacterium]